MANTLWFDMDGTIYPLYQQKDWLKALRDEDAAIFLQPVARRSMKRIREAVRNLMAMGWKVGVITWAPMGVKSDEEWFNEVRNAKMHWMEYFFPEIDMANFFCLEYGTPKAEIIARNDKNTHVLIDDNKVVRHDWRTCGNNFITIDANKGFCKILEGMAM